MATRKKAASPLLQLKIELAGIKPLIWRRVVVPETITLAKLHRVIQAVMGWTDSHLHEFEIAAERYGVPDPDDCFGLPVVSEARVTLRKTLGGMASFRYVYDFGDDWVHKIKVERAAGYLYNADLPWWCQCLSAGRRRRSVRLCRFPRSHWQSSPFGTPADAQLGRPGVRPESN